MDGLSSHSLAIPSILETGRWAMRGVYWSQDGIASEQQGELWVENREADWYLRLRSWNPESALTWEVWAKPWRPGITRHATRAMSTLFGPNQGVIWLRGDGGVYWRYRIPRMGLVGSDVYLPNGPDSWLMRGQLSVGRKPVATYEWHYERIS